MVTNRETAVNLAEDFVVQIVLLKNLLQTLLLFNGVHCARGHLTDGSRSTEGTCVSWIIVLLYLDTLCAVETVRVLTPPIFNFLGIKSLKIVGEASVEGLVIVVSLVVL